MRPWIWYNNWYFNIPNFMKELSSQGITLSIMFCNQDRKNWLTEKLILISTGQFMSVKWGLGFIFYHICWFKKTCSVTSTDSDRRVTVLLDMVVVFSWTWKTGQFQSNGVSVGRQNKKQVAESWYSARLSRKLSLGLGHQCAGCPRVSICMCT